MTILCTSIFKRFSRITYREWIGLLKSFKKFIIKLTGIYETSDWYKKTALRSRIADNFTTVPSTLETSQKNIKNMGRDNKAIIISNFLYRLFGLSETK